MSKKDDISLDQLGDILGGGGGGNQNTNNNIEFKKEEFNQISDNTYVSVDINLLPGRKYYKNNFVIKIRKPSATDIQKYLSMVDREQFSTMPGAYIFHLNDKMMELVKSCTKVFENNAEISNDYIKNVDLVTLTLMLKELKYPNHDVSNTEVCSECKLEYKTPIRVLNKPTLFLQPYQDEYEHHFNKNDKCYIFNINNSEYRVSLPNIGINTIFLKEYFQPRNYSGKYVNMVFMNVYMMLLFNTNKISKDGIEAKSKEFETTFDDDAMQMLNSFSTELKPAKQKIKSVCPHCGSENESDFESLESGFKSLFINSSVLDKFKKK